MPPAGRAPHAEAGDLTTCVYAMTIPSTVSVKVSVYAVIASAKSVGITGPQKLPDGSIGKVMTVSDLQTQNLIQVGMIKSTPQTVTIESGGLKILAIDVKLGNLQP